MPDDTRALLLQLPNNGLAMGNGTLLGSLGWDEARYDAARDALVAAGLAEKGRGRGGSLRQAGENSPRRSHHGLRRTPVSHHACQVRSRTLATLRDSLLPKLLSGELSVNELNVAIP